MKNIKKAFIVCWMGELPDYFPVWLKTCETNPDFHFLIFSDQNYEYDMPQNVQMVYFTLFEFIERCEKLFGMNVSIKRPYRICDFRPFYGKIFKKELENYQYWGYCDLDLVFGKLSDFITEEMLSENDIVFNCGSLTLIRNCEYTNNLYKLDGALYNYKTVIKKDALFAYDEFTGIQRIAKYNNIKAHYLIPYIDAEVKYFQLISRFDKSNPKHQAFYWEDGKLYRVKAESGEILYQNIAYIHLQKRKIVIKGEIINRFWICPWGYEIKKESGKPTLIEVQEKNPYQGIMKMRYQKVRYNYRKIKEILHRSPYQVSVRIRQQLNGINRNDSSLEERIWTKY